MAKKGTGAYHSAWSHDDLTERFFPTGGPLVVNDARYFRTALDVYQHTGDATVRPAIQVSNDPDDWPACTTFARVGTHNATADGITYSTGADVDMSSSLQARYYREGFTVQGTSGGTPKIEKMLVAVGMVKRKA